MTWAPIVLLDANVLYSALIRDVLLQLAVSGQFAARWTIDIQREWVESVLRRNPGLERARLERTSSEMESAIEGCLVTDYEPLIPELTLPDPDDRHVLAAAIVGRCDFISTFNLGDFPKDVLAGHGVAAIHPDDLLCELLEGSSGLVCEALRKVRARLKSPPLTPEEFIDGFEKRGLRKTASKLKPLSAGI